MKTLCHRELLALMRTNALRMRNITSADYCAYNFSARMRHAAESLKLALDYREMARQEGGLR